MGRCFAAQLFLCVLPMLVRANGSELEFHAAHKKRIELTRNLDRIVEAFNSEWAFTAGPRASDIFGALDAHFVTPRIGVDRFGVAEPFPNQSCSILSYSFRPTLDFELDVKRATSAENCSVLVYDCQEPPNTTTVDGLYRRTECISDSRALSDTLKWHLTYDDTVIQVKQHYSMGDPFLVRISSGGWEYSAMRSVASSLLAKRPPYVTMLARLAAAAPAVPWAGRKKSFGELASFVDMTWRVGGFYLTSVKLSEACGDDGCAELTFALGPAQLHAQQQ